MTQPNPLIQSTKRPYRSKEQWSQLIDEYEVSGLSIDDFCAQNDLKYMTFYKWRKRLQQNQDASPTFIELARTIETSLPQQIAWDVELELGSGVVLRLRRD